MRNCSDSRAQRWHYGCPRLMRGTSSPLASSPQRFEPSSEHEFTIFVPDRRCVRGPRDVPPKRARGVDAGARKSDRKDCRSRLRGDSAERRIVRGPGALSRVALRRDSGRLSDPRAGSRVSVAPVLSTLPRGAAVERMSRLNAEAAKVAKKTVFALRPSRPLRSRAASGVSQSDTILAARGETPAAFGRRCIPAPPHGAQSAPWGPRADCVAPPSNIPDIAPHRAQDARWGPRSAVVAPCQRGASPPSVRRWTFTTGC